eukprot:SAG31_NODE_1730_length_7424_cov_28.201911_3_plen_62_part_00
MCSMQHSVVQCEDVCKSFLPERGLTENLHQAHRLRRRGGAISAGAADAPMYRRTGHPVGSS